MIIDFYMLDKIQQKLDFFSVSMQTYRERIIR